MNIALQTHSWVHCLSFCFQESHLILVQDHPFYTGFILSCVSDSKASSAMNDVYRFTRRSFTRPAQTGQPHFRPLALEWMTAFQTCPSGHCHQTFLLLPAVTISGVKVPFSVGCHCFAMSGSNEAKSLKPGHIFFPAQ